MSFWTKLLIAWPAIALLLGIALGKSIKHLRGDDHAPVPPPRLHSTTSRTSGDGIDWSGVRHEISEAKKRHPSHFDDAS